MEIEGENPGIAPEQNVSAKPTATRRIVAFILDLIALGIIGLILGAMLSDYFVLASVHGILIGWFVSTICFAMGNSKIMSGQTVGKNLMKIEVVGNDGEHLSFTRGLTRALWFTTPYFLIEYFQGIALLPEIMSNVLGALNIAYYVGLVYFFFINKNSHQTVHDIFTKTLVKHVEQEHERISTKISKSKVYVYAGIVGIIIASIISTAFWFTQKTNLIEVFEANEEVLTQIVEEVYGIDEVLRVESSKIHVDVNSDVGIVVDVWTKSSLVELNIENIYDEIIEILNSKSFKINRLNYVKITLKYGYDIGIANYTKTESWKKEFDEQD